MTAGPAGAAARPGAGSAGDAAAAGASTALPPDPNAVYALGRTAGESLRLRQQAEELEPDSRALLDRVGLRPGQAAIDLGCGPRGILDLLAERVGAHGRVVGLDADATHVAMATAFARERGLACVEVFEADARDTRLPSASFDLVHARTLLVNVPDPEGVVAEMVRLARPGGEVAAAEPDTEYQLCYPPDAAVERLAQIFPLVFRRAGADNTIGRRVPEMFRAAGLTDVGWEIRVQSYPAGHSRRTVRLDLLRSMRRQIVEMGLAGEAELDELDASARRHLLDPDTVAASGHHVLVWGRKPG